MFVVATVAESRLEAHDMHAHDVEDALYQSVVDAEFRVLLVDDPSEFDLAGSTPLPDAIEMSDQSVLDLVSGMQFTAQCRSTCSSGPLTIICDGTTK